MEAREDDLGDLLLLVALGDEVAAEDLQPAFALPDLFPEVRRAVAALRVHRIARRAVVALVEGQEVRRRRRPASSTMWTSRLLTAKWTSAPMRKGQQRLGGLALGVRQAVEAVLVDRVADALREVGLQLHRRDRHAVEEQHKVDAVLVVQRIAHLPHDPQAVGGVAGEDVGVDRQRRLELRQLQRLLEPEQLDAVPQHVERAALVELIAQAGEQRFGGVARRGS